MDHSPCNYTLKRVITCTIVKRVITRFVKNYTVLVDHCLGVQTCNLFARRCQNYTFECVITCRLWESDVITHDAPLRLLTWFVVRCSLFVCQRFAFPFVVRRSSFTVRRSWFVVRGSSFVVRRSSFVVRRSSFVARRSSFVARRSSFVARRSSSSSCVCPCRCCRAATFCSMTDSFIQFVWAVDGSTTCTMTSLLCHYFVDARWTKP